MSEKVRSAMFAVKICDKCKDTKIIGDTCVKCKLDKVIESKINLNIELVAKIDKLEKVIALYKVSNDFYSDGNNWRARRKDKPWFDKIFCDDTYDVENYGGQGLKFSFGGKLARETERKVKEILGE